ncbi:MAG: alkaline phosphatase family protein [Planctomycetota bacterium]|nr:alkaline phosphatase family protein [Planctomycetota bacterium]
MAGNPTGKLSRREMLKGSAAVAAAACLGGLSFASGCRHKSGPGRGQARRVIVIGIDGMDPMLAQTMMAAGLLPTFAKLRDQGGFRPLGTSIPPQSPVAWANFINGAGPGSHGIFDFIHRRPEEQCTPFYSAAETVPGKGYWNVGDHRLQLTAWPFNHQPPATLLRRQGVPFWDHLDEAGIESTFYDLPSNYPPSPSKHGRHRCLAGMGVPDMLGSYGTYQVFAEDVISLQEEGGGRRSPLLFDQESATATLIGPENSLLKEPKPTTLELQLHRDREANAAVIEIPGRKILLKTGQWSPWVKLEFTMSAPALVPDKKVGGIARFYLQEAAPNFRLYVSPINIDPSNPAVRISEPGEFVNGISSDLGLFPTAGFQEDHKAFSNRVFTEDEFITQAGSVLDDRLRLLDHALHNYDDGLLFFYFSSTDLQSHMLWWDPKEKHPTRSAAEAAKGFDHIHRLYQKMDSVVGDLVARYGDKATVLVMSDHGFGNFGRQFGLNTWLRQEGYLGPAGCKSIMQDVDWSRTRAYGLGINGLYLNLKGRERDGIVEPAQREELLVELQRKLEAVRDADGRQVIGRVYRADKVYSGSATALAPDLIVGYHRGYRASWATCLGGLTDQVLMDNDSAWSADHCADAAELPGVLFSNRPIQAGAPSLIDMAPSILTRFGLSVPGAMEGKNFFVE